MKTVTLLQRAAWPGVALAAALAACGGGFEDDYGQPLELATAARVPPLPPLVDDEGRPQPPLPAALPARGDQFTRTGLYALRAQAEALDRALAGRVIWLDADCCGGDALDLAVGLAAGMAAASDLRSDAPVFVTGDDGRQAAAVADQLGQHGWSRVFVVTH